MESVYIETNVAMLTSCLPITKQKQAVHFPFSRTGEDALSYFEIIASGRRTRQFLGRG